MCKIPRITRSRIQLIFSLSRKLEEKNKNTRGKIENPLADLGISLEIKVALFGSLSYRECLIKLTKCI